MRTAALAGLVVLAAAPSRAAVVVAQTSEQLARQADAVVLGTVVRQIDGEDPVARVHVVKTEIRVGEAWKGRPPSTISLWQFGALRGGKHAGISGDADFTPGEEVVLFLSEGTGARAGAYFLLGLGQGKFSVVREAGLPPRVTRDVSRLHFRGGTWRVPPPTLDAMKALVVRVARETP